MKKLNLNVPINSLGYGVVGYNLWKELNQKCDVTLWPIPDPQRIQPPCQIDEQTIQQIRLDVGKQDNYDYNAPSLKVWHENHLAEHVGRGKYYALPFFEVNKFNDRRISHLLSADEVIVTSQWAKDIILKETAFEKEQVHVVPCGVDRNIFNETNYVVNREKCIFFNCGKWETRKGHDILYKAFKDAFPNGNEPVELWMMTENPFLTPEEKAKWESLYNDPRIKLIPRVQYQEELATIMGQTFCGVFPSRAEGWNLEALEMMACGKQVIITNYSAHTEFCNEDNSLLINIDIEEPMYDGKWFVGDNGTWASLEGAAYESLVNHLIGAWGMWFEQPSRLNHSGIETSKELSWSNMATTINNIVNGE
jgi:glycosyltransferase involved in cell wall biosynthesis